MIGEQKFGETIIDRLDELERTAGVTDDIVTQEANLRARDIKHLRTGSKNIDIDAIRRIAMFFGVTMDYLLNGGCIYRDADIAEAKPDVISLNEYEAECIARLLQSVHTDPGLKSGDSLYSCSFCKYYNDCMFGTHGHKEHELRGSLREKFGNVTGIKSGVMGSCEIGRCMK